MLVVSRRRGHGMLDAHAATLKAYRHSPTVLSAQTRPHHHAEPLVVLADGHAALVEVEEQADTVAHFSRRLQILARGHALTTTLGGGLRGATASLTHHTTPHHTTPHHTTPHHTASDAVLRVDESIYHWLVPSLPQHGGEGATRRASQPDAPASGRAWWAGGMGRPVPGREENVRPGGRASRRSVPSDDADRVWDVDLHRRADSAPHHHGSVHYVASA
jgi:hypothetical protein